MKTGQKSHPPRSHTFLAAFRLGLKSITSHPWLGILFITATLIQGVVQAALVWRFKGVLLAFSAPESNQPMAMALGAASILGLWITLSLGIFLAEVVSVRLAQRIEVETMEKVLRRLLTLSVRFFEKNSQGDLVMSTYNDCKGISRVSLQVGQIALLLSRLIGLAVAAWIISPKLTLIGIVTIPLAAWPAHKLGRRITQAADRERSALRTLYDNFLEVSSGIRMIKVNCGEDVVLQKARLRGREMLRHIVRQADQKGIARCLLELVSGFGLILVLTIGGKDVANGKLEWQSLLGLLVAIMAFYQPVVGLLQTYTTIRGNIPNLDRVARILQSQAEITDAPHPRRLRAVPEKIELRNVSFDYGSQLVLDSISVTFQRGETIGIVGPSGSGKSSLIALLLRFYDPTSGSILLDGVDMRLIRHADLFSLSALVLQEPLLFVDTIANNIRIGRPGASMEEVIAAAKAANLHDEIMAMEHGYETVLGRRNDARGVSGGQKQRVCIAAALLKNAPILFLDEATSSLDSASEQKVQAAIDHLMRGRTTFVIAHRLSTLHHADRILVLNDGHLVGFAPHVKLLETCETYRHLWNLQNKPEASLGCPEPSPVVLRVVNNGEELADADYADKKLVS